jgi:starch phosphorylase
MTVVLLALLRAGFRASSAYLDHEHWTKMPILTTAGSGKFFSDRAVREYCQSVRGVEGRKLAIAQGI